MKIDRRRFIEIKSDKKVDRQIITINENGVVEISREMQDVLKKNVFSLHISEDSRQLLLDPAGSGTVIRNDEPITAKYLIQMIDERVAVFPMNYKMIWEPAEKAWLGELQTPRSLLVRKREQLEKMKERERKPKWTRAKPSSASVVYFFRSILVYFIIFLNSILLLVPGGHQLHQMQDSDAVISRDIVIYGQ